MTVSVRPRMDAGSGGLVTQARQAGPKIPNSAGPADAIRRILPELARGLVALAALVGWAVALALLAGCRS